MYTATKIAIAAAALVATADAFSPSMSLSTRSATHAKINGACALRASSEAPTGSPLVQRRGVVAAGLAFLGGAVLPKESFAAEAAAPAAEAAAPAPAAPAPAQEAAKAAKNPTDKKFTGDYVAGEWLPIPSNPKFICCLASSSSMCNVHASMACHVCPETGLMCGRVHPLRRRRDCTPRLDEVRDRHEEGGPCDEGHRH